MIAQYAPVLIGLGVAALALWLLNRKSPNGPVNPDDVTPARKNRFQAVENCWYTVAGLADQPCFKDNDEAQKNIASLKNIIVEELRK